MNSKVLVLSEESYETHPFPHFGLNKVFSNEYANDVLLWLKDAINWELTKTDFYTQYEFSLLDYNLPVHIRFLIERSTITAIISKLKDGLKVEELELVGITAHKLINGHRIGIHNDYIGNEETHRIVIQLSSEWSESNGGYLMLFDSSSPTDVCKVIKPIHNTGLAFEISSKSFHAVSTINNYSRFTLVYTFRALS